jgi:hypothetical protein
MQSYLETRSMSRSIVSTLASLPINFRNLTLHISRLRRNRQKTKEAVQITHMFLVSDVLLRISARFRSKRALDSAWRLRPRSSMFKVSRSSSILRAFAAFAFRRSSKFPDCISALIFSRRNFFSSISPARVRSSDAKPCIVSTDDSALVMAAWRSFYDGNQCKTTCENQIGRKHTICSRVFLRCIRRLSSSV